MLVRALSGGLLCLCLLAVAAPAPAQSSGTPPPPDSQIPTLQMSTRIVLTDVTVTDSKGNPIHGLTRSDFHIFDDNRPQTLNSFAEHIQSPASPTVAAPASSSTVSNDFLLHPPDPVNVILIDTTSIRLIDQLFLYEELTKFVTHLPPGAPVAIYNRSGDTTLLLQNFTSDHTLLMAAIRRAVPQFRSPGAWYTNDFDTLTQMAAYLSQVPGRKNLLWFSSGSNLFLQADPTAVADQPSRRPLYDQLESERISIYPIDARGLTVSFGGYMASQRMQMEQDAQATGGEAYYNNNGLAGIAAHIISTDSDYYTLTYAPQGLLGNSKWHRVKVTLDNPHYHLSYRQGYYDDDQNNLPPPGKTRTMLRADGSSTQVPTNPGKPIIFQARVLPASDSPPSRTIHSGIAPAPLKKGQTVYTVHYTLPISALQPSSINGNIGTDSLRSAIIVFDHYGNSIARVLQAVTINVDQNKLRSDPSAVLDFDQQINLPNGEDYLYIVVWDTTSNRFGTINVPLDVKKLPKTKS